jgi:hypothetical protein
VAERLNLCLWRPGEPFIGCVGQAEHFSDLNQYTSVPQQAGEKSKPWGLPFATRVRMTGLESEDSSQARHTPDLQPPTRIDMQLPLIGKCQATGDIVQKG